MDCFFLISVITNGACVSVMARLFYIFCASGVTLVVHKTYIQLFMFQIDRKGSFLLNLSC